MEVAIEIFIILDLRESNLNDPESVVVARRKEIEIIESWINGGSSD